MATNNSKKRANANAAANLSTGSLKVFASSLKTSLDQNRQLQKQILSALESLSTQKANNRRKASRLTRELYLETEGIQRNGSIETPELCKEANVDEVKTLLKKVVAGDDDTAAAAAATTTTTANSSEAAEQEGALGKSKNASSSTLTAVQERAQHQLKRPKPQVKKLWSSDLYREWNKGIFCDPLNRSFFSDPLGSTPQVNPETLKRRRIEAHVEEEIHLAHLSPQWAKPEDKLLETLVSAEMALAQEEGNAQQQPTIDFEKIAKELEAKRKPDKDLLTRQPRTGQECKLQYERLQFEKQPRMTKSEEAKVVEQVQSMHAELNPGEEDNDGVDWKAVAEAVGNNRSPWQCFSAYQKIRPPTAYASIQSTVANKLVWTPKQDEILLTYIAAMGPQFILDMNAAAEMSRKFFPDKTAKQITLRCNQTMVNPKLQQAMWTVYEERKLVLAQKVYRDDSQRVPSQFPQRSARSVREKWNRTLDPAFNKARPFSKQEDKLLRRVIKTKLEDTTNVSGISWFEVAKANFPDRRPEQLQQRWTYELASNDDLLHKMKVDLLAQQQVHGQTQDDFVLKVAKKPRKTAAKKKR